MHANILAGYEKGDNALHHQVPSQFGILPAVKFDEGWSQEDEQQLQDYWSQEDEFLLQRSNQDEKNLYKKTIKIFN